MQIFESTVKDGNTIRGNQRKSFGVCILISIEKWIFIKLQGRDQPGRICDPVEWQIGTSQVIMDPSSLFAEFFPSTLVLL